MNPRDFYGTDNGQPHQLHAPNQPAPRSSGQLLGSYTGPSPRSQIGQASSSQRNANGQCFQQAYSYASSSFQGLNNQQSMGGPQTQHQIMQTQWQLPVLVAQPQQSQIWPQTGQIVAPVRVPPPIDFLSMRQAPPTGISSSHEERVSMVPPVDFLSMRRAPSTENSSSRGETSTGKTTTTMTEARGAAAREEASAQGAVSLEAFDLEVRLMIAGLGTCPKDFDWCLIEHGHLCDGGHHFIRNGDIDKWAADPAAVPRVLKVHSMRGLDGNHLEVSIAVHPPRRLWRALEAHIEFMSDEANIRLVGPGVCHCANAFDGDWLGARGPFAVIGLEGEGPDGTFDIEELRWAQRPDLRRPGFDLR